MEPSGALNLSAALFQLDEKLMNGVGYKNQQEFLDTMKNSKVPLADLNNISVPQGLDNNAQMPVFINQARLSNFYQNNPAPVLQYSQRFGLPSMGGPVNMQLVPGAYVQGVNEYVDYNSVGSLAQSVLPATVASSSSPMDVAGMAVPSFTAQNFYNKTRQ
jgi:hypothetical protein